MKTLKVLSFVAGISFLLSGCSGKQGPAGPQGNPGLNGVANIHSQVVSVSLSGWSWVAVPGYYTAFYNEGYITDPNNEAVEVYLGPTSTGPWQTMPCSHVFNNGDQMVAAWTTNNVTFDYDWNSLSSPNPVADPVYFNVVVIPAAIMKQHPNTNWKDSKAVLQMPEVQAAMNAASTSKNAVVTE